MSTAQHPAATAAVPGRRGRRAERRDEAAATRTLVSSVDRRRPGVRVGLGVLAAVAVAGLLVVGLGPLLWLAKAAVSSTQDVLREPFALWPSGVQWENLPFAWTNARIGLHLGNTAVVALGCLVVSVVTSTTAAYVLSVLRPRWAPLLSAAVLVTLFIPGVVLLVPLYLTVLDLPLLGVNLLDSFWAVWLPAGANAFNILVMKRFFDALPHELFEAARIDGAGSVRVLVSVVLPLSRPILAVVSLLTVVASWKDFLWPLLVLPDPAKQPISVALPRLTQTSELSIQMAGLFLAVVVPVLLFVAFQRQFFAGVGAAGGIKG